MVILAIGVRPNGELAKSAELKTNKRGGIVVDKHMRTSDEDIYAVGDAVEINDFINDVETMIPLAGPANKQGRIAADNIAGKDVIYKGTQGTSVAKVFDMTVSATGSNEKILKRLGKEAGKDYDYIYIHPNNHAGYYPDASKINMKLLFSPDEGKILGAQAVGFEGVEKRIDVIATAIRFGGTVYDLTELELAYAPPFGSAKDPVNMAGFVAENYLKGTVDMVHWNELGQYDEDDYVVLDVRDEDELETGCYQKSVNIPLDSLRERADELDRNKMIFIYCAVGLRGYVAARILNQLGFGNVKNLSGGMTTLNSINYIPNSMLLKNILGRDNNNSNSSEKNDGGNEMKKVNSIDVEKISLNCSGLQCPGPIMKVFETIKTMNHGDLVEVTATDMGFAADVSEWCKRTGNTLVDIKSENKAIVTTIMKGLKEDAPAEETSDRTDKSMVIFSGDLDKVIAGFIIANGAAAMGRDVTMFFTFWGLNALRKAESLPVKKTFMEKMFGFMMPRGAGKLKLSNMNMAGMGSAMMKSIMKQKNVDTLETLIENAKKSGIRMVACTMSMDVMGIKEEELIDGVEYGGVASFLAASERSDATLFI